MAGSSEVVIVSTVKLGTDEASGRIVNIHHIAGMITRVTNIHTKMGTGLPFAMTVAILEVLLQNVNRTSESSKVFQIEWRIRASESCVGGLLCSTVLLDVVNVDSMFEGE